MSITFTYGKLIKRALIVAAIMMMSNVSASAADWVTEPTQRTDAPFRLFRTQNLFTLLQLDTRTGQVWQLQWSNEIDPKDGRFIAPIGEKILAQGGKAGRFTLYPTQGVYTFILLDQETGSIWQVVWGGPNNARSVFPIN